jgi:hypothetical protein
MDELPIIAREDDRYFFQRVTAQYDAPAYVRRARRVQEAYEQLLGRCRRQRDEWLRLARIRLGMLRGLAGDWSALTPFLQNEAQTEVLERLHADLRPELRVKVERSRSQRTLTRALEELCASLDRFNGRWRDYIASVDLAEINELREGYNRYYLLEKECAVRSVRVARQGYHRLAPLTVQDIAAALPPLAVPRLKT